MFKRDDKTNPSNYRPISLLSSFAKIFEKLIMKRLVNFLDCNSFFSNNQFGFRSRLSTEDALLQFLEPVYDDLNKSKYSSALFIDITKAFDTVDHEILIEKMWYAGIRGLPLKWFSSYLYKRSQYTKIANNFSSIGFFKTRSPSRIGFRAHSFSYLCK